MFKLIEWIKDSLGKETGIHRGYYKSIEDAELEIPKDFVYSEDPKLIDTLPRWTIFESKSSHGIYRFYVRQKKMENLKKVLKFTGNENADSLQLPHEEFVQMYRTGKVDYRLPKRYINLFYVLLSYRDKWNQIIVQILLLIFWGGIIFGIYLLFRKEWLWALTSLAGGYTVKKFTNAFVLKSIEKGLLINKKYYTDLLDNGIIGIYDK